MNIFVPFKEIKWIDQIAHMVVSAAIVAIASPYIGLYAILLSMIIAIIREQIQHFGEMGDGSRTDLAFWFIGGFIVSLF